MHKVLLTVRSECGVFFKEDGKVRWRVWAPHADRMDLALLDGDTWTANAMKGQDHGYFACKKAHIRNGQRDSYRLNGGPNPPDPASHWQPEGVNQPSAVLCLDEFQWSDADWSGIARADLVFYELHVGTFTPEGTFDAVIPRLPALRELGVTAIEIMPVAQFSGTRNWGYDGVHPYAPQHSYGGPHGLQRLVDA